MLETTADMLTTTLRDQISECFQNLRKNALKPDVAPALKTQMKHAKQKSNKDKLLELEEKKKIIAEIIKDSNRYGTP